MGSEFDELQATLQSLRTTELRKIQRKALTAVGELVEKEMKAAAPVKTNPKGGALEVGELRESIKARVFVPTDEATLAGRVARVTIGPTCSSIVKLVAHDVEFGHGNAAPNPFIRRTEETTQAEAIDIFQETLTSGVQKAMS